MGPGLRRLAFTAHVTSSVGWIGAVAVLIMLFATVVLLIYMRTFDYMATVAADPTADLGAVPNSSPIVHAALALLILLVATVLATYKPQGITRYGRRVERGGVND